jgi:hypothetical protein
VPAFVEVHFATLRALLTGGSPRLVRSASLVLSIGSDTSRTGVR